MLTLGQVVYSKNGRTNEMAFVVVALSGEYAYLSDGGFRKIDRPKKKKEKHIQPTNTILKPIKTQLENGEKPLDAHIRKALAPFYRKCCQEE